MSSVLTLLSSNFRVSVEDIEKCEERFSKSKRVHQIICHISQVCLFVISIILILSSLQKYRIKVEDLNKQITWPLHKKYGHALDAFKVRNSDRIGVAIESDHILYQHYFIIS